MTDLIDRDGFRANVGIVLMNGTGQLFLGRRPGGRGWQFPQGGMLRGEGAEDSLFRELKEEIGLRQKDVRVLAQTRRWLRYRLPARYQRKDSQPRCVGQKQRWFLLEFRAEDSAIRFDTTSEPEFDSWRWVDFWQPVREVIYFKRPVYTRALHELGTIAFPDGLPSYPAWWRHEERPARAAAESSTAGGG
jgi:putative (di)nucleoside polyphosphate hydrolase